MADSSASSSRLEDLCSRGPPAARDGVCTMHGNAGCGGAAAEVSRSRAPSRPMAGLASHGAVGAEGMEAVRSSNALASRELLPPRGSGRRGPPAAGEEQPQQQTAHIAALARVAVPVNCSGQKDVAPTVGKAAPALKQAVGADGRGGGRGLHLHG